MAILDANPRLSSGISGLDEILDGGFLTGRTYLVRGGPGTGKTTLGLHFLQDGVQHEERVLFITLEESHKNIQQNNANPCFDIEKINFLDVSPTSEFFSQVQSYDIFSAAEVEREPLTRQITAEIEKLQPTRVFLDPVTQFRYLNPDTFQFRKQMNSLLRYLVEQGATVLVTSENSKEAPDDDMQFMCDGVVEMNFIDGSRTLSISKMRGSSFRPGTHGMKLSATGIEVFPRLLPINQKKGYDFEMIPSGIPEIDELLHGGIERGTVTIISGPSGVGKTTLGMQFMKEAAGRGERSVVYTFEEEAELILKRSDSIGLPARKMLERGTLELIKIEPLQYSPDEFAHVVRMDVEKNGTQIVMVDSIAGYSLALKGENIQARLHALAKYLQNLGIAVIIINEVESIVGDFRATEAGISHLADNIIFLRYLEIDGSLKKAIGVLKKRLSSFEQTLRELEVTRYGIKVGKPLTGLSGILRGIPEIIKNDKA
jgi:circadian clock protein KaiC